MIKYAEIVDKDLGLVNIGLDDNSQAIEFYKSIGYKEMNVKQSDIDNQWYLADKCPMKTKEQKEKEKTERISRLSMTKQDFFNFVLKPQGFTYDALMQIVDGSEDYKVAWNLCERVYRGDKNLIGAIAIFLPKLTEEELDNLFEEYGV